MSKRSRGRKSRKTKVAAVGAAAPGRFSPSSSPAPVVYFSLKKRQVALIKSRVKDGRKAGEIERLALHRQRVAAIPQKLEAERQKSSLSLAKLAEPDGRKSSVKAREAIHCKKRPDSKKATRGLGGSKRFVPWC